MKKSIYSQGLYFSCVKCSACCRHESGIVVLTENDLKLLADFKKMGYNEFTEAYCRWVPYWNGAERLSLKEKPGYDCIFWEDGCSVYPVRPLQCRAFPFWESIVNSSAAWKSIAASCPGMNKGTLVTRDEIESWLGKQAAEKIIVRKL